MSFLSGDSFLMIPALFRCQQRIVSFTGALYPHPVGENRDCHQQIFAVKPILPICTLDPYAFAFVDTMDPISLIDSLGWLPMGDSPPPSYCPAAVRAFYSNLRIDGLATGKFSTLVYGHLLTLSVDDLDAFLILPTRGKQLISPLEFWSYKFDLRREVTNRSLDSLDDSLKLLHYYTTRVYFPRGDRLDVIFPLDCWVMSHAISDMPLSYPHLLFGAIVDAAANDSPSVGLPFAALITLLLQCLGVPLADFVTISDNFVHPSIDEVLTVVGLPPIVDLSSGGDVVATHATIGERGEELAKDEASADGGASVSASVRPFKLRRQAKGPLHSSRVLKRLNNQKHSEGVVLYENHDLEQNN
ncbi:unnamed protein product [Linum trigynum]|uniref:Aminotransferase-like plant mobile domain-containing protein n=1 Tax=Linum trigynum TaxID=586398 RepID=A0AAV2FZT3_9ROSI